MYTGTILVVIPDKGFGFLIGTHGKEDLFFHASGLLTEVAKGDTVQYTVVKGRDGRPRGANIKVITENEN